MPETQEISQQQVATGSPNVARTAIFACIVYAAIGAFFILRNIANFEMPTADDFAKSGPFHLAGEMLLSFTVLVVVVFVSRRHGLTIIDLGFSAAKPVRQIFLGFLTGVALAIAGFYVATHYQFPEFFHKPNFPGLSFMDSRSGIAFVIAAVASVQEEIFFRGMLQGLLKKSFSVSVAIVVAALFFGLFHVQPIRMISSFLSGCLFGILREKYASLIAPIVAHVTLNSFIVAFVLTALRIAEKHS